MTATDTHCPYCALQCGMTLTPGIPTVKLEPRDFPVNKGGLCAKGFTAADLLDHRDRLLTPRVRKVPGDRLSPLREATWDEALSQITEAIQKSQAAYGRDSVGAFGGGGLTNDKAYALGKFVRVALRSSAIDYNGRFCMSSAATAANRALGVDRGLPFPLADVAEAKTVLLVGASLGADMASGVILDDDSGATPPPVDPPRPQRRRHPRQQPQHAQFGR